MEKIVEKHNLVTPDKGGADASQAIFLVIQHADKKVDKQEKYFLLMKDAVEKSKKGGAGLAMLEDRIAKNKGKKQKYGSQISFESQAIGPPYAYPYSLENPDNVDKLRLKVGLMPLKIYLHILTQGRQTWDLEKFKKEQIQRETKQSKP